MEDLRTGRILVDLKGDANEIFTSRTEYGDCAAVRKKFTSRLRNARSKTMEMNARTAFDVAAVAHDRLIFPVQKTNVRNEPRWEGSKAQGLLRIDVAAKIRVATKPQEFYNTRCEYMEFSLSIFRGHIYQEEKRQKFIQDKYNYRDKSK